MGFIREKAVEFIKRVRNTFCNTHFSVRPVRYCFITRLTPDEVRETVQRDAGIMRMFEKYNVLMGYCRGNRITLFKISFSARFLAMMRPFHAYMLNTEQGTKISGSFRFSLSTIAVLSVWLLNDVIRLIGKLRQPAPSDFIGHIISLCIVPFLILRMIWSDKSAQGLIVGFMKSNLGARELEE